MFKPPISGKRLTKRVTEFARIEAKLLVFEEPEGGGGLGGGTAAGLEAADCGNLSTRLLIKSAACLPGSKTLIMSSFSVCRANTKSSI